MRLDQLRHVRSCAVLSIYPVESKIIKERNAIFGQLLLRIFQLQKTIDFDRN